MNCTHAALYAGIIACFCEQAHTCGTYLRPHDSSEDEEVEDLDKIEAQKHYVVSAGSRLDGACQICPTRNPAFALVSSIRGQWVTAVQYRDTFLKLIS